MSTNARIKTWLEGTGPKPDWIDARDPTDVPTDETDVTITIPGWLISKVKPWLSTVLMRFGCASPPIPDAPDAPDTPATESKTN